MSPQPGRTVEILLVHMRKDDKACTSEYETFLHHSGLTEDQLTSLNLFHLDKIDVSILDEHDAFILGGYSDDPSDTLVIDEATYPFIGALDQLLQKAIQDRKPALLSCGGFMLSSVLLGGQLTLDRDMHEMDIVEISLNEAGVQDILFAETPARFNIVSGHLKSTNILPENTILLGSSEKCPHHIFKLTNAPIYAFQGHPEITAQQIKDRIDPYIDKYFDSHDDYLAFVLKKDKTDIANALVKRFVGLVQEGYWNK